MQDKVVGGIMDGIYSVETDLDELQKRSEVQKLLATEYKGIINAQMRPFYNTVDAFERKHFVSFSSF